MTRLFARGVPGTGEVPPVALCAGYTGSARAAWLSAPSKAGLVVAALLLITSAPGFGDPARPCWAPGGAPGLFDWPNTPGIACRNAAEAASPTASAAATGTVTGPDAGAPPQSVATDSPVRITVSGSAYFGLAASF